MNDHHDRATIVPPESEWHRSNYRYMLTALELVRNDLIRHINRTAGVPMTDDSSALAEQELHAVATAMPSPPALEEISRAFGLSPFERYLLLLAAGVENDPAFGELCAAAQGSLDRTLPSWNLALSLFQGSVGQETLLPTSPLRWWGLVSVQRTESLITAPVQIDEGIYHRLFGMACLDERLWNFAKPVRHGEELIESHREIAARIALLCGGATPGEGIALQLCGGEHGIRREIAATVGRELGRRVYVARAADIPPAMADRESLLWLWNREVRINGSILLLECDDTDAAGYLRGGAPFLDDLRGIVIVTAADPLPLRHRPIVRFDLPRPTTDEQRQLWQGALGERALRLSGAIDDLVGHFNLGPAAVRAASAHLLDAPGVAGEAAATILWDASRTQARARLEDLARRIEPVAGWEDLVLPDMQYQMLREITAHVRQRMKVYEEWGFAGKSNRGFGISAMFAGASGTGKTMAAEVIARDLRLDLYHIDLSQVVSKYIGETEKNLRRIFDTAEEAGAVLLFDEADALFGKRSEVKDSHDRHANIEVSYLLQRMEAYRGLAILTTNMKQALDTAFLRRIRFVVNFPFPEVKERAEIWRRIFPAGVPREGLDTGKLARLGVAGGNIRNIALNAAFLAADEGEPVQMRHMLRAVRSEYMKLEKQLTDAEVDGWLR